MKPLSIGLLRHPVHFLALGFGAGLAPRAPGTAGTLVAVPMVWLLQHFSLITYVSVTLIVTAVGVAICGRSAQLLGVHDHPAIVWDEIAGYLLTMMAAPEGWLWLVLGFLLFRLFDILKPWPIRVVDRQVHGGLGIMLDDLLAGLLAWVCLQLVVWSGVL